MITTSHGTEDADVVCTMAKGHGYDRATTGHQAATESPGIR